MKADQLRKAILQMAIQGKLVPQDPSDEPASVLLEKIRLEKQKLIKEGKIKKDKFDSIIFKGDDNRHYEKVGNNAPVCIEDELPFDIPDSWEWSKISNISFSVGTKENQILTSEILKIGAIPVVSQSQNIIDGYTNCEKKQISILPLIMFGDHTKVVKYIDFPFVIGADGTKFHKAIFVYPKYFYMLISFYALQIPSRGYARHYSLLKAQFLPIPPLVEQQRIVAEIEKYEPLIAEYNKLEQQKSKLDGEIYDKLKKSILQYAIQGKLVPQDENDEPASILLEKIRTEKKAKLGKKYVDSYIYKGDDNCYYEHIEGKDKEELQTVPFDIPDSWCWVYLPQIAKFELGKTPDRHTDMFWNDGKYLWFSISDMKDRQTIFKTKEKISKVALKEKFNDTLVSQGTLLMSFKLTVGKTSILGIDAVHNEAIISIFPYINDRNITRDFLLHSLGLLVNYVDQTDAIKGATLNSTKLKSMLIPLPPFAEQQRIVDKLNEIFAKL